MILSQYPHVKWRPLDRPNRPLGAFRYAGGKRLVLQSGGAREAISRRPETRKMSCVCTHYYTNTVSPDPAWRLSPRREPCRQIPMRTAARANPRPNPTSGRVPLAAQRQTPRSPSLYRAEAAAPARKLSISPLPRSTRVVPRFRPAERDLASRCSNRPPRLGMRRSRRRSMERRCPSGGKGWSWAFAYRSTRPGSSWWLPGERMATMRSWSRSR
jgi:hypothetical protein